MSLIFEGSAPSNIALIKYMGKSQTATNHPTNSSLSYTLDQLRSFVMLSEAESDHWTPLGGFPVMKLSDTGREKFLRHLGRLKQAWKIEKSFAVQSANNFPSDCGLASSASSFAALTEAVYQYASSQLKLELSPGERSKLSRLGSGSSCRSFFSPWAAWRGDGAEPLPQLTLRLKHAVILVDDAVKTVSSSEAHVRVLSSPKFAGRPERAEARQVELEKCLVNSGGWARAFQICWDEFQDMHELFETSVPAFRYMTADTHRVLGELQNLWRSEKDGPLVTLDAGANIHLLWRADQVARADRFLQNYKSLRSWAM